MVQKELTRAERDNDLIYHKDVPAVSDLPAIPEIKLVGAIGANDLREPRSVVPHGETLFGELVSWGVKAAISKILPITLWLALALHGRFIFLSSKFRYIQRTPGRLAKRRGHSARTTPR